MLIAFFVAYNPAFGVIDDHTLVDTLLIGKKIPLQIFVGLGRYFPLNGQELNILSSLFALSPQVFYAFNALCLILVGFLFSRSIYLLLREQTQYARLIAYLATLLTITTPAFMTSWLRLFVPERMEFVFFAIFFHSYVLLYTKSTQKQWLHILLCVFSSLIALFYKETAFILLGAFAFCHIVFCFWNKEKISKLDFTLLANCLIWIVCYFIFVLFKKTGSGMYGDSPYNRFYIFLKDVANYFSNDTLLVIGLFTFLILRFYSIVFKRERIWPFYDAMLVASFVFILSYMTLGMSTTHYALPAYLFAIPAFCYFILQYKKNVFFLACSVLMCLAFVLNCIPLSVYYSVHYKFVPINFQNTLHFLREYAKDRKIDVYLEGTNRASCMETYVSFQSWMKYYGIQNFDFFSDIPIDNVFLGVSDKNSPYSVFRENSVVEKKSGDIVILVPYTGMMITDRIINEMKEKYQLLYVSDSGVNVPLLGFRTLAKWIGIQMTKENKKLSFSHNIYGLPIYFYVFRVR